MLASWLFDQLASDSSKRLKELVFGSDLERALSRAAASAIQRTAGEMQPDGAAAAADLARVIDHVFGGNVPSIFSPERSTLLESICDGVAKQVSVLADPDMTGTGQSWAELNGMPTDRLAARLAGHLVQEIMSQGTFGGPLVPLADHLNHELTRLQLAGLADQVTQRVIEALDRRDDTVVRPAAVTAFRSLPGDLASFTGRRLELERLEQVCRQQAGGNSPMRIVAIDGMAGVGKTAFALHAAHRLASRFPGGQWFLDLHSHTPGQRPVKNDDALAALLRAAGVAPGDIPEGTDDRAARWRDRIAGRKLLLLLDDAASTAQIRSLLPGTGEALVLVTSRRRLTALPAMLTLALGTLSAPEAAQLLIRRSGRSELDPGDEAVARIAKLCGFLPLALSLVAAQLRHHHAWVPDRVAAELAATADSLRMMAAEDISVTAALNLSYDSIPAGQRQLLRRLGMHPGSDIDHYAAAALNNTDPATAMRLLNSLFDYHLIEEADPGRFSFHDLIRRYARALAAADPEQEREAAISRLEDYYLQMARTADRHLAGYTSAGVPDVACSPPTGAPDLPTRAEASAWMDAERSNLDAAAWLAAEHDRPAHAIAITAAMQSFLRGVGYWDEAIGLQQMALQAARRPQDRLAEAAILTDLAITQRNAGYYQDAMAGLARALGVYRELSVRLGEANALGELGVVQYLSGDYPASITSLTLAVELYRLVSDRRGVANSLTDLAAPQALTGEYAAAIQNLAQAQELYHDLGNPRAEADVLYYIGSAQQYIGQYVADIDNQVRALRIYRAAKSHNGEANALNEMGTAQRLLGRYHAAVKSQNKALKIYKGLGNQVGEASVLNELGAIQNATEDYAHAAETEMRALALSREASFPLGEANALCDLGSAQRELTDYVSADANLTEALRIFRKLGNRIGEANALIELGALAMKRDRVASAYTCYEDARDIAESIGALAEQARASEGIGRCLLNDHQPEAASAALGLAQNIYEKIGSPSAQRIGATFSEGNS